MALLSEVIPKELHEKPYLKDFLTMEQTPESFGKVFAKLDGAESLIGKRAPDPIPARDAKPEDWDKFLANLRPEKADDYEIPVKEGVKPDVEFLKELRESFHKGDISKRQAQRMLADFMPKLEARAATQMAAQKAAQAKADADFEALAKATYGDKKDEVLARVNAQMKEHAPAAVKPFIDKLDNNHLIILSSVIEGILKKYASEDDLNPKGGSGGGDGGKSAREKGMALMATEAFSNWQHPEHAKTVAAVKAFYEEAGAAGAKV